MHYKPDGDTRDHGGPDQRAEGQAPAGAKARVGKLLLWVDLVGEHGLEEVRKIPGFHDEPLRGVRAGQRSIRLNAKFRAFYRVEHETIEFVDIFDVNAHKY